MTESGTGSRKDLDGLVEALYSTLHKIATREVGPAGMRVIEPTELVHECYLKLARTGAKLLSREQFVALAARAIRTLLVDRARELKTLKRGGDLRVLTLVGDALDASDGRSEVDLLALDVALEKLAQLDERQSRVVELRFFGGLTHEEIGRVVEVSPRTVNGDWAMARAWLHRELLSD